MSGEKLIFLISQPRSGSSLLQQLLISSGKIVSAPEPWFMLPLVYTYKNCDCECEFNFSYGATNFKAYLDQFDCGTEQFRANVKELALKLYAFNKLGPDKPYFLDKTPRYYHITDELLEMFPESKFIVLVRNPISVFASIIDYNFNKGISRLYSEDRIHDLYTSLRKISDLKKRTDLSNVKFVKYEDLVEYPAEELMKIYEFLNIEPTLASGLYSVDVRFATSKAVDKKSLGKHTVAVDSYIDSWKAIINNSVKKGLLIEYLNNLGKDLLDILGYDHQVELKKVKDHKVKFGIPIKEKHFLNKNTLISSAVYIKVIRAVNKLI